MNSADVGSEAGRVRIVGNGNDDTDIVCGAAAFELSFGLVRRQSVSCFTQATCHGRIITFSMYSILLPE